MEEPPPPISMYIHGDARESSKWSFSLQLDYATPQSEKL